MAAKIKSETGKAPVRRPTYGEKPRVLRLDNVVDDTNKFMIGSEVGDYLGIYNGSIYKRFPSLWRKVTSVTERKMLLKILDCICPDSHNLPPFVTLVKATEIEEIVEGRDLKYRGAKKTMKAKKTVKARKRVKTRYTVKTNKAMKAKKTVKAPSKHSSLPSPLIWPQECQLSTSASSENNEFLFLTPDCLEYMDTIEQAPL